MALGNSVNWAKEAETMARTWTEAQKNIWTGWFDLVGAAPTQPMFQGWIDGWRELTTQGFEMWATGAEPPAKDLARQLAAMQEAGLHLFQFLSQAWQAAAANVEEGQTWQQAIDGYLDQLRQQWINAPAGLMQAAQEGEELWRIYLDQEQRLGQPWLNFFQHAPGQFSQAALGNGSALVGLNRLYRHAFDRTFGRLLDSPGLGYTREFNEKVLSGFKAWRELRQASFEYQVILAEAWLQALQQFLKELAALAEKGEAIQSVRELVSAWTAIADPVFEETFRSEKYIKGQGQLLNAAMIYRLHQREITEQFLKANDLPTRTEIDQAHHNIYRQRKEIKALKKTVEELSVLGQGNQAMQNELAEARRTMTELGQEVQALRQHLTARSQSTETEPDTKPRRKRTTKAKTTNDDQKGDNRAAVSDTDNA